MRQKRDWSWIKIFLILGIGLFFLAKSVLKDRYIQQEGITTIVVVSFYERVKPMGKGQSFTTYSFGHFKVGYRNYKAYTDTLAPIGTKFEIKYNPKNPEEWRRIQRIVRE